MTAFLAVMGSAVVAEKIGLTLAVGAFIGGLVLSLSPYAHQLYAEVLPLRGVLLGTFFTAVGMLFDPATAAREWPAVLAYTAGVVVLKSGLVAGIVSTALRMGPRLGILTGLSLAQTGEFSFVLAASATAAGLLPPAFQTIFVAGSLVTLIATPFLFRAAPWVAAQVARILASEGPVEADEDAPGLRDHAVIVGFGVAGRNLSRVLTAVGVPTVVIDANSRALARTGPGAPRVVFGDATRAPLLERVGVADARFAVVVVNDPIATREIVALVRRLAPRVKILARTRYVRDLDALETAGADVVVAEELEGTVSMVSEVLRLSGVSEGGVARFARELREEGYEALRAPVGLALDPWLAELLVALEPDWVDVPPSFVRDASLAELEVRAQTGATVLCVERFGVKHSNPEPGFAVRAGDRLLTLGTPAALDRLRALLARA